MAAPPTPLPAAPKVSARSLFGFLQLLEKRGWKAKVRELVAPATARCIDSPPLPSSFVDRAILLDLYAAVASVGGGEDAVADFVREATVDAYGPLVRKLLDTVLGLFGRSPDALLSRIHEIVGMYEKDTHYTWIAGDGKNGVMEIRFDDPAPRLVAVGKRGLLTAMLDVAGFRGTAQLTEMSDDGKCGRFRVWWW